MAERLEMNRQIYCLIENKIKKYIHFKYIYFSVKTIKSIKIFFIPVSRLIRVSPVPHKVSKIIPALSAIIFTSLLSVNPIGAAILPSGIHEIESPYKYFLRKSDFYYLYDVKPNEQNKESSELLKLSEDFLDFINKREFKRAEKSLIQSYNHPYYLLNLILLYIYLDQPEYKNHFLKWQESVDNPTVENLIDIFAARKLNTALKNISMEINSPELKRYALYKIFKEKNQPDLVLANFSDWEQELKVDNKRLFDKAYKDWLVHVNIKFSEESDRKKYGSISGENRARLENDLIHQKYTRDVLSKYIEYLMAQNQWGDIQSLIAKITWLTEDEKKIILQKTAELEKQSQQKKPTGDYIKVKIIR
jgi:hypothetical protein